jgi:hypothetical protein
MSQMISQQVKNIIAGISQQPANLRRPEQLEAQINAYSTETGGLQKRPPTLHVAKLHEAYTKSVMPFVHFIKRDNREKYIVIFTGIGIEVYDEKGNPKTVTFANDACKQYILSGSPRETLRCASVADYTFITNRYYKAKMASDNNNSQWDNQGVLVNIKSGQYGRTYRVVINGAEVASYTTPDGSNSADVKAIDTNNISSNLASQVAAKGYSVTSGSSWFVATGNPTGASYTYTYTAYPSTTVAQEQDRLRALGAKKLDVGSEQSLTHFKAALATAMRMVDDDSNSGSHIEYYVPQSILDEIARCQNDYWTVTKDTSSLDANSNGVYSFTMNPQQVTVSSTRVTPAITSCEVYDGYNNQAATATLKSTQKFTNLPASAPDGFTVRVAGDKASTADDYYVRYNTSTKLWEECAKPGIPWHFDNNTMPHVLIRQADGTFIFKEADWNGRVVGDEDSNPEPSFINNSINDIFFYRNRLGFLSSENIILSGSADFFNFWMSTVADLRDTDCIDTAISSDNLNILYSAIMSDNDLILFARNSEFKLSAEGNLTPTNCVTGHVSDFSCSSVVKPVGAGRRIYFPTERALFTSIKEMYTATDNTDQKDVQDVTAHVPSYIPNGVYKLSSNTAENVMMILTSGAEDKIYIYKYLFVDGVRQQASWSHWDFNGRILGGDFIDSEFYIIIERCGFVYLEKMSFTYNTIDYDEEPYRVFLDRKIVTDAIPASAYNATNNVTTLDLISLYGQTDGFPDVAYGAVFSDGKYQEIPKGTTTATFLGNLTGQKLIIGQQFTTTVKLSELMLKESDSNGGFMSYTDGRLQLRYLSINYKESGYFTVEVVHKDKLTYEYKMTGRVLSTSSTTLNKLPNATGIFKVPLQCNSKNCSITILASTPTPLAIVGFSWEGAYVRKSKPV